LCHVWENDKFAFAEYVNDEWVTGREGVYGITQRSENFGNAWLVRDYKEVIDDYLKSQKEDSEDDTLVAKTSKRYGEISIRQKPDSCYSFEYSDQFGLLEKK
jgi:hypothetical protein